MAQAGGNIPILILQEGTGRSTGRDAQRNNIMAAKVVAETVASSLGPRGMDKMLVSGIGDIVITNDGATIMKELDVQHPAAKMLVEVAKTQDNEVGDGTTTAVILAGQLLSKAEKLLDLEVHPTVIVDGYKKAADRASEFLNKIAVAVDPRMRSVYAKLRPLLWRRRISLLRKSSSRSSPSKRWSRSRKSEMERSKLTSI